MSEQDAEGTDDSGRTESNGTGQAADAATDEAGAPASDTDAADEDADGPGTEPGDPAATLAAIVGDLGGADEGATAADGDASVPDAEEVDDELLERIGNASPETTARGIAALRARVEALEDRLEDRDEEVADLESRLKRKQADFQNYKRRQNERMEEEKRRATEDLVGRLLDVRDNLERALDQDEDADIRGGVESTLRQFDEQLDRENVDPIEPEPGDEVDPGRHEALATIASDQPEDAIAQVHRPGYEMAGKVLRPAQVAVSDGSLAEADDGTADGDGEAGTGDADHETADGNGDGQPSDDGDEPPDGVGGTSAGDEQAADGEGTGSDDETA